MYSEEYEDEKDEEESGSFIKNFYYNNKVLVWIFIGIILFILIMSLLTKGGSGSSTPISHKVTIESNGDPIVQVGHSLKLIASAENDPQAKFTWSSSNEEIAKVDNGNVTGLDYGKAIITAVYEYGDNLKESDTMEITVADGNPNVELVNVTIVDGALFMPLNSTYEIKPSITPPRALITSKKYTSTDTNVVRVDNNGMVTSVGVGKATVKLEVNDITRELQVYVDRSYTDSEIIYTPESISFVGELRKIKVGSSESLDYTLVPSDADHDRLVWKSNDESIVTVEKNGKIRGVSVGRTSVTVTSLNGLSAKIDVEVESDIVPVTDIVLSSSDITINAGQSQTIMPSVLPDNASNKALNFLSLDSSIAAVDANDTGTIATVIGVSQGSTSVIVKSANGVEKLLTVNVVGSNNDNNGGSNNNNGGGSSSDDSTTIKVRVNGDMPDKTCTGQVLTYYDNPQVNISLSGGISKIKYCYSTSSKCTPSIESTSGTSFTIGGKGVYTLRIKKYDRSGNEIASSNNNNYVDGALEYYINTKASGTTCNGSGSNTSQDPYITSRTIYTTRADANYNIYPLNTQIKFTVKDSDSYIKVCSMVGQTCDPKGSGAYLIDTYDTIKFSKSGNVIIMIAVYRYGSSTPYRTDKRYITVAESGTTNPTAAPTPTNSGNSGSYTNVGNCSNGKKLSAYQECTVPSGIKCRIYGMGSYLTTKINTATSATVECISTTQAKVTIEPKVNSGYDGAFNESANVNGTFTNTIPDTSKSCIKFPETRYSQPYNYTVGTKLGIPVVRVSNNACIGYVDVVFVAEDGTRRTASARIEIPEKKSGGSGGNSSGGNSSGGSGGTQMSSLSYSCASGVLSIMDGASPLYWISYCSMTDVGGYQNEYHCTGKNGYTGSCTATCPATGYYSKVTCVPN